MTSTVTVTSWASPRRNSIGLLVTYFSCFPRALGPASAESTRHRRSLEVEWPFHETVGTGAMHVPCGLCPSLTSDNGYSALWHVPAALSPCALSTLEELLDILAFLQVVSWTPTQLVCTVGFGFPPYQALRFISLDTWRVVRSWDMLKPTSFCWVR